MTVLERISASEAAKVLAKITRSKYGVRTDDAGKLGRTVDGVLFASQKEALRYVTLKHLQFTGEISHLELQPRFPLHVIGNTGRAEKIGKYVADFRYRRDGCLVIEDVKGVQTDLFRWKKKHAEAEYGITIVIV